MPLHSTVYTMVNPITYIDKLFHFRESCHTVQPYIVYGLLRAAKFVSPNREMELFGSIRGGVHSVDYSHGLGFSSSYVSVLKAVAYLCSFFLTILLAIYALYTYNRPYINKKIYLVDFSVFTDFRPEWTVSAEEWAKRARKWFNMDCDNITFTRRVLERSGIGPCTHFPPGIAMFPPDLSISSARYEAEIVMFGCIDQLLKRNNIKPKEIDILVVNCSLFNPTPSLAAMIINNYKLRSDITVYNLAGMGCSASPIAIDLASDLLRVSNRKHPLAIVISMENITQNIYMGSERAMMVANSLFRMGGAAILLSRDGYAIGKRPAPRYKLTNLVRIHMGADTNAYTCVFQDIDKENKLGVRLDKSLMKIAARCLEKNLSLLAPQILPLTEKIRYIFR
uniref:3-ketoacyl-CoA synthase 1 n=1 Tax=Lygus hesperus TaxID=30085 RepID=A0A0A9YKC4_LYGHE